MPRILDPRIIDNNYNIYVHDQVTSETTLISIGYDDSPANGFGDYYKPVISDDGRYVAFSSSSTNLTEDEDNTHFCNWGETVASCLDAFVHDRQTGVTTRISVSSDGIQANNDVYVTDISGDGRFVIFESLADNLVINTNNNSYNSFVHDRQTGKTHPITLAYNGEFGDRGGGGGKISNDGSYVGFISSSALVPEDMNNVCYDYINNNNNGNCSDVFVSELATILSLEIPTEPTLVSYFINEQVLFHAMQQNLTGDMTFILADIKPTQIDMTIQFSNNAVANVIMSISITDHILNAQITSVAFIQGYSSAYETFIYQNLLTIFITAINDIVDDFISMETITLTETAIELTILRD